MTIYHHDYVICPCCGGKSGRRIDHLYDDDAVKYESREFGPWECDGCHNFFDGKVTPSKSVTVYPSKYKNNSIRRMNLLRFDGKGSTVFFVIDSDRHVNFGETDKDVQSHQKFFFEEHSCPTNWLEKTVAVIENGDCDPHGFLKFIRCVDVPRDFDPDYDELNDPDKWARLFPEAFEGLLIDGKSADVSRRTIKTNKTS